MNPRTQDKKAMRRISLLQNTIQEYQWGSHNAIADLLGLPMPSEKPQAELWMGAHPKAPSKLMVDGGWKSLTEVISENPEAVLGKKASDRFEKELPFLFKVLAAAQPLSIQAHPDKKKARVGFEREERARIRLDAAERNYRDTHHKPECLCALTPFHALKGFRNLKDILIRLQACCAKSLWSELEILKGQTDANGLKQFFSSVMTLSAKRRQEVIQEALEATGTEAIDSESRQWMQIIANFYPNAVGILAPLMFKLVSLEPGQAIFLSSGVLHSYLSGVGIELMAASDNVLRGGLTSKHIDVPELIEVVDFRPQPVSILAPVKKSEYEVVYKTPAEEFVLSVICVPPGGVYHSAKKKCVEILLCTEGEGVLYDIDGEIRIHAKKGDSFFVPAAVSQYTIDEGMIFYKATVP